MPELKLSTAATMILTSLAEEDRHGYAIRKDVARKTGDEVELGITTLYRVLKLLLDDGLVEEIDPPASSDVADERRRYYRITARGRRALAAEVRRLERVLAAARTAVPSGRHR